MAGHSNDLSELAKLLELKGPGVDVVMGLDVIGGVRLMTKDGQILNNVFVKSYERVKGSVMRVSVELVYLAPKEQAKNW